jgi:hypothetical protein
MAFEQVMPEPTNDYNASSISRQESTTLTTAFLELQIAWAALCKRVAYKQEQYMF